MGKALLFLTFLTLTIRINAQEIEWQNTIGGSGTDKLTSTIQTTDGGYLLAGYSISGISGDKTELSNGMFDYWIVKIDSIGSIQWQNTIGGNSFDYLNSVIKTSDGGYLLGGSSNSNVSGDKDENSIGDYDYWIVKTDSIGIIQWQNTIGGSGEDQLYSVTQTTDGGYILGGTSTSDISGDKTENSEAEDYWIVKINYNGFIQWQNTIGGYNRDELKCIIQTSDVGYLLGGWSDSNSSGDKTENAEAEDYWIVKTDSSGLIQWQNTIGGCSGDEFSWMMATIDSCYILGGYSNSDFCGDKTQNSFSGNYDYWVIKIDALGGILWQNTIGGDDQDFLHSISSTTDGGFLLGGTSSSDFSGNKTESSKGNDYFLVKIDSAGQIEWQNTIGGDETDELHCVIQTIDENYLLAGSSNSFICSDKNESPIGSNDYWILKITDDINQIQGKTYTDLNSNLQQDPGDPPLYFRKITETNSGRIAFSQPDGFYSISVLDTGNFEVVSDVVNFYSQTPMLHSGNFTVLQQIDSVNDFAYQPALISNDLCIVITPTSQFRSGFDAIYGLNYFNQGTTPLTPTIVFYPDTNVSFVSASIFPTSVTSDSIIFVLGTLTPFQYGQISIIVSVNSGLPIGTLINSGAMILPIVNDANPGCNSNYFELLTTGSFDPNDILVNRSFLYSYEIITPIELEYIIHFQNTGNDTAFSVKLINSIDTNKLDISSLEIVATSHNTNVKFVYNQSVLEFVMNNILLPDSNTNEPMSHGFVRYRIKPKTTVAIGDSIQNFAAIYFDFNAPVITNTAVTHIILPTGLNTAHQNSPPVIFPNPANNKFTIRLMQTTEKINSVTIYNLYGQQVENLEIAPASSTEVDISSLAQGVYFVKINNDHQFISKIVKY